MQGKTVILCEGVHDLIFFSILCEQNGIQYDTVYHKELRESRERTPESNKVRDFLGRRGRGIQALIKDEDGWQNCIDNFVILYEDMNPRYRLFLCLDDDQKTRTRLKDATKARFRKDILLKQSACSFLTKDANRHQIFFIPGSLEKQIKQITGKNPDLKGDDGRRHITEFIDQCRREESPWLLELESLLSR
ncbi:MAG: hypothetical protein D5R99_03695 [Methanocalculus sp. MSAO_Arc1]|uniref:hypothetical protein n=1 Tax=Methanocalculus TaxID=71151 RepID=UPI000FED0312|nr:MULTISPECIES: hypothetical protein [unclassified Methanocalculus]MCP1661546.1 hypothetical protein [Methanocalculus sp. AMF5]RQD80900.1 MAG: hypothetical protein D5R99_03695 [Methanocalculus sp. MSAO_Arc1]